MLKLCKRRRFKMDKENFVKSRNALLGETLVKTFKSGNFEACYCETKEDACKKALAYIEENSTVSWGGSMSIFECGLVDKLKSGNYKTVDRSEYEDVRLAYLDTFNSDTYVMSANAVSLTGELVNIDGTGNRLSALCFGPKQVIVIVSLNKVMPDLESAVKRAKSIAAPVNIQRFPLNTPCKTTGTCSSCHSEDCICSQILITRFCRPKNRIKIVFCGENLGF